MASLKGHHYLSKKSTANEVPHRNKDTIQDISSYVQELCVVRLKLPKLL